MKEVELGFLDGPMDDIGISAALGTPNWLLNPRFLLLHGGALSEMQGHRRLPTKWP